ncbi:MAG: ImmA/IrrE family metallo-endopeptidase [Deltaproteobacteria bacterium]|nr:ImmA/IrrE family metallo-endopeptidase [Deltaproteobacteria bacterium]
MFTPSRLTLARKRRGWSKTRLAEAVGVTTRAIAAFESGDLAPSDERVADMARVLGFPRPFFGGPDLSEPTPSTASFRALKSMTAGQRDSVLAAGALAMDLCRWIDERFQLPAVDVPSLRDTDPETAAATLRSHWGLGELSIRNVVHLLESRGVRVFSLAEDCHEVNAFSLWLDSTPFVFLNTAKSAESSRFDAAHELAHLVLHAHGGPRGRDTELEADRFASAFLMPRSTVLALGQRWPGVDDLIQAKRKWGVSVAALAHRLHGVGLVTDWHYRTLCIDIARRGFRTSEPNTIPRETSQVFAKVFSALRAEGMGKEQVAQALCLSNDDLDALVFGLVILTVRGGQNPAGRSEHRKRSPLRLV